ncbi:Splicing factor YJU2 [Mytilus edulis]|uniref:Splicing factor YJU2 n=1 Tax=Mytilus edulis TaxID=6550 RepID=A0A8S3SZR8_MYTED|nr:Splicing factor YJU2 [Mytilus edulis]
MSERKVLNKYYPADFDPNNIPKMKREKNRPFNIRLMAPCNMRCDTCGVYIYKGKKFNSRKEDVEDETFLGLRIFRFYIKCPSCVSEIAFKTDLKNTDYVLEAGATRLFEAEKLAKQMAEKEQLEKEQEELNNPMKLLENRTKASRNEIETIDALEEIRDMNSRKAAVDHAKVIEMHLESIFGEKDGLAVKRLQSIFGEKDGLAVKRLQSIFGEKDGLAVKRLQEDSDSDEDKPKTKKLATEKPTDILSQSSSVIQQKTEKKPESWEKSVGGFNSKKSLKGLVVRKKATTVTSKPSDNQSENSNNSEHKNSQETEKKVALPTWQKISQPQSNGEPVTVNGTATALKNSDVSATNTIVKPSGLGLLGNYSDSDSSNESN